MGSPHWKKIWRRLKRRWWLLLVNLTRLPLLLTTLREQRKCSKARLTRMRRGLLHWRRTSKRPGRRRRLLMLPMTRLPRNLHNVRLTLRRLKIGLRSERQRLLNWEKTYKEQIKSLAAKLNQAVARAEFAEKSVMRLQKEVDRLEDELVTEQEKFKAITEELEQTFAEMSG